MDNDDLLQSAMVVARGCGRLVRRMHGERTGQGPAPGQMSVLALLQQRGPMTPSDLATAQRVQPQSLTRILTSLEADGLISRQPDATDGRRSLVAITPSGSQAMFQVMAVGNRWLADAMARQLTAAECQLLCLAAGLMERLAETGDAVAPAPVAVGAPSAD
jgi:DNA-binding MarR family transcriptional regulator